MIPLIPAYWPPSDERWPRLLETLPPKSIIIANPNNGFAWDMKWVDHIRLLQAGGHLVVGYVPTGSMSLPVDELIFEADEYKRWYNVDGIFWDEVIPAPLPMFKKLHGFARAVRKRRLLNDGLSIFNPGYNGPFPFTLPKSIWVTRERPFEDPGKPTAPRWRNAVLLYNQGFDREHHLELIAANGWSYGWAARQNWHEEHL